MKAIGSWFGKCRNFYRYVYHEYMIYLKRRELLRDMLGELIELGFYIMSDNNTIRRVFYVETERFKNQVKKLALKTDSNKMYLTDKGVFLRHEYMYFNWPCVWSYLIIPCTVIITAIWLITKYLII